MEEHMKQMAEYAKKAAESGALGFHVTMLEKTPRIVPKDFKPVHVFLDFTRDESGDYTVRINDRIMCRYLKHYDQRTLELTELVIQRALDVLCRWRWPDNQ